MIDYGSSAARWVERKRPNVEITHTSLSDGGYNNTENTYISETVGLLGVRKRGTRLCNIWYISERRLGWFVFAKEGRNVITAIFGQNIHDWTGRGCSSSEVYPTSTNVFFH